MLVEQMIVDGFIKRDAIDFIHTRFLSEYVERTHGIVAGGCFKNVFDPAQVKDVDVFFRSENEFVEAVRVLEKDERFSKRYENNNVIAFFDTAKKIVVELCRTIYGEPQDILSSFDFTVTKFALFAEDEIIDGEEKRVFQVLYSPMFFEHLHLKRLVLDDRIPHPYNTLNRMFRYCKYGYAPCRETKVKIIEAVKADRSEINIDRGLYAGID